MRVSILLNSNSRDSMTYGFRPETDTLVNVIEYDEPEAANLDEIGICEKAFERFNIGEDAIAKVYRQMEHRSLSKGDVVALTNALGERKAYACASFGWDELPDGTKLVVHTKFRCPKIGCSEEFVSDAERYDHGDRTGHIAMYW